jgi:hypothetical protein
LAKRLESAEVDQDRQEKPSGIEVPDEAIENTAAEFKAPATKLMAR